MGFDLVQLIQAVGYVGLIAIVFAESGLFFGFFLPGDSLLLTAGVLAAHGQLNIFVLLIALPLAALFGDNAGYWFGKRTGKALFSRDNSLFFRRKNLLGAKAFYERHGGKTIVLARFMPFIRTFAPIVAGAVEMDYRRFFFYNAVGAVLWGVGVTLAGFFLGNVIPHIDRYFLIIIAVVVLVSALPGLVHVWRDYRHDIWRLVLSRGNVSKEVGLPRRPEQLPED